MWRQQKHCGMSELVLTYFAAWAICVVLLLSRQPTLVSAQSSVHPELVERRRAFIKKNKMLRQAQHERSLGKMDCRVINILTIFRHGHQELKT